MKPRIGIDLVYVPEFTRTIHTGGMILESKIFSKSELDKSDDLMHLAGLFAAKEAIIKALSLPVGSWLKINIKNAKNGKPHVTVKGLSTTNFDLSISHNGDYATAIFIITK